MYRPRELAKYATPPASGTATSCTEPRAVSDTDHVHEHAAVQFARATWFGVAMTPVKWEAEPLVETEMRAVFPETCRSGLQPAALRSCTLVQHSRPADEEAPVSSRSHAPSPAHSA